MSRRNRANRDRYLQAGRLTPDEMARERQKQMKQSGGPTREGVMNRAEETPRQGAQESSRPRSAPEE